MSENWDYAKASKWMSENGGPKQALEKLENFYLKKGYEQGKNAQNPKIVFFSFAGIAIGCLITYGYNKYKDKKRTKSIEQAKEQEKLEKAEDEVLQYMNQEFTLDNESV